MKRTWQAKSQGVASPDRMKTDCNYEGSVIKQIYRNLEFPSTRYLQVKQRGTGVARKEGSGLRVVG